MLSRRIAIATAAATLSLACHSRTAPAPASSADAEIRAVLDSTAAGWNRGDLGPYMAAYAPDADAGGTREERGRPLLEPAREKLIQPGNSRGEARARGALRVHLLDPVGEHLVAGPAQPNRMGPGAEVRAAHLLDLHAAQPRRGARRDLEAQADHAVHGQRRRGLVLQLVGLEQHERGAVARIEIVHQRQQLAQKHEQEDNARHDRWEKEDEAVQKQRDSEDKQAGGKGAKAPAQANGRG